MCKITINALVLSLLFMSSVKAQDVNSEFKPRPKEFEFYHSLGDSIVQLKMPVSKIDGKIFQSKIPYPIIFIHGLNSNYETWNTTTNYLDTKYGFTYGGRFDFCLNSDGNNVTTNKNFYPAIGADIAAFETTVQNGDYFNINFNVKVDGSYGTNVLSNQAAVAKQGAALKRVIARVLQLTGKDKVVLVGHSMGGLAAREYIQNSYNWQADNRHHVAKLLSVGTPHGGSNASDNNSIATLIGTNLQSEAIRDLKTNYYYSGEAGKFMFGGKEIQNSTNMNDNSYTPDFYNVDINCNGIVGETIVGLNKKPIDHFIDFSNVIGRITNAFGSSIATDGVVTEASAKMNNYLTGLTYPAKVFYFNSGYDLVENHTELPGYYYQIMQGLDEPNFKELAYEVAPNKNYVGHTTVQAVTGADHDFYKFTVTNTTTAAVAISSIITSSMNATILNSAGTAVGAIQYNSGSNLSFSRTLTAGNYFLKITSTTPTSTNYQTPYNFIISTNTQLTPKINASTLNYYPNPVKDMLHLENMNVSKATVYSLLGQQLDVKLFDNMETSNTIDMSGYAKGIYMIVLESEGQPQTIKIVKE